MENLVIEKLFGGIYENRKVLLTGHSGFKGSWLLFWLRMMGAQVRGFALPPPTNPSHIEYLKLMEQPSLGDIRNADELDRCINEFQPEIVFHLAAQALVRKSYMDPIDTFQTNVLGTAHVLQSIKQSKVVKAIVNVTTDKVYENKESLSGYVETDTLGGYDPYSTSKVCVEWVHHSYHKSFYSRQGIFSASARAGNVIGGGDWAEDRLIPDLIRAIEKKESVQIRNPNSIRPWQHVLDPLSGYLLLGQKLLESSKKAEGAWNFGPSTKEFLTVEEVLSLFKEEWPELSWNDSSSNDQPHETNILVLDCSKAMNELSWKPVWDVRMAIKKTASWYKQYYMGKPSTSMKDIETYISDARNLGLAWSTNS